MVYKVSIYIFIYLFGSLAVLLLCILDVSITFFVLSIVFVFNWAINQNENWVLLLFLCVLIRISKDIINGELSNTHPWLLFNLLDKILICGIIHDIHHMYEHAYAYSCMAHDVVVAINYLFFSKFISSPPHLPNIIINFIVLHQCLWIIILYGNPSSKANSSMREVHVCIYVCFMHCKLIPWCVSRGVTLELFFGWVIFHSSNTFPLALLSTTTITIVIISTRLPSNQIASGNHQSWEKTKKLWVTQQQQIDQFMINWCTPLLPLLALVSHTCLAEP